MDHGAICGVRPSIARHTLSSLILPHQPTRRLNPHHENEAGGESAHHNRVVRVRIDSSVQCAQGLARAGAHAGVPKEERIVRTCAAVQEGVEMADVPPPAGDASPSAPAASQGLLKKKRPSRLADAVHSMKAVTSAASAIKFLSKGKPSLARAASGMTASPSLKGWSEYAGKGDAAKDAASASHSQQGSAAASPPAAPPPLSPASPPPAAPPLPTAFAPNGRNRQESGRSRPKIASRPSKVVATNLDGPGDTIMQLVYDPPTETVKTTADATAAAADDTREKTPPPAFFGEGKAYPQIPLQVTLHSSPTHACGPLPALRMDRVWRWKKSRERRERAYNPDAVDCLVAYSNTLV